jgi:maleylacetoacetate isomerase
VPQAERDVWVKHWIVEGFTAFEALLQDHPSTGAFCDGNVPTIADCCLIPQIYNARRFSIDMTAYPNITRIEAACMELPAFDAARPERQPDAP